MKARATVSAGSEHLREEGKHQPLGSEIQPEIRPLRIAPPGLQAGHRPMRRQLLAIGSLALLLFLLDRLYRVLYPEVNLERASLVGLTALAALTPLYATRRRPLDPVVGALAILASAVGSVLLIDAGVLASQSLASGAFHVLILAIAFVLVERSRLRNSRFFRAPQPADGPTEAAPAGETTSAG